MPKGDKLPIKQLLFIKYYLIDKNATQAYIKAGYNGKGAESSASKLLTNPKVKAIIDAELNKTMNELDITAERVLKGFKEVAERSLQRVPVMYYDKEDKEYKQKTEN
jgi:phage terminase small subunit